MYLKLWVFVVIFLFFGPFRSIDAFFHSYQQTHDSPKTSTCFQKLISGKKASKHFVRVISFCDNFEECEDSCLERNDFYCFGFNFRHFSSKNGNKCELVDVPLSTIKNDAHIWDYDHLYDYFERSTNNSNSCQSNNENHLHDSHPISADEQKTQPYNSFSNHYTTSYSYHDKPNHKYSHSNIDLSESRKSVHNHYDVHFQNNDCSVRLKNGCRLYENIVRRFITVATLSECEKLCYNEQDFNCNTYSYRYSFTSQDPTDNCYLSDKPFRLINTYKEIEPNQEYDTYAMNNLQHCSYATNKYQQNSDCFLCLKQGYRLDSDIVKEVKHVKSLTQCEYACLIATDFVCRGFSFSNSDRKHFNCQLTNNKWFDYVIPDNNYNIYKRDSFGHGCERDKLLPNFLNDMFAEDRLFDNVCYDTYAKPSSIKSKSSKLILQNVQNDYECCNECTNLRQKGILHCLSFSYSTKTGICRFSNLSVTELILEDCLDEDEDGEYSNQLHLWNSLNRQCDVIDSIHRGQFSNDFGDIDFGHQINKYKTKEFQTEISDETVNGYQCKDNSFCQLNLSGQFWFCEIESGRQKHVWDYCCSPDHKCGYSTDYEYPWCYVGFNKTQWRKCSINNDFENDKNHEIQITYLHKENPTKIGDNDHDEFVKNKIDESKIIFSNFTKMSKKLSR